MSKKTSPCSDKVQTTAMDRGGDPLAPVSPGAAYGGDFPCRGVFSLIIKPKGISSMQEDKEFVVRYDGMNMQSINTTN